MSDFDKIIHDRLNEETEFGGLEQNWQQLSTRLEGAFPPPSPWAAVWRWLGLAAIVGLAVLNLWFFNRLTTVEDENARLTGQVADLENRQPDTVFINRVVVQTDTVFRTIHVFSKKEIGGNEGLADGSGERSDFLQKLENQRVENAFLKTEGQRTDVSTAKTGQAAAKILEEKNATQPVLKTEISKTEKSQNVAAAGQNPNPKPAIAEAQPTAEKTGISSAQPPVSETQNQSQTLDFQKDKIAPQTAPGEQSAAPTTPAEAAPPVENRTTSRPDSTIRRENSLAENANATAVETAPTEAAPSVNPNDFDASAGAQPIPKHKRNPLKITDFTMGVHYTSAIPLLSGVKPMKGFGFSASVNFTKNLRFGVTHDRTTFKYDGRIQHARPLNFPETPKSPFPGGPHFQRIQVEQRRQVNSLRLDYLFPVSGGLKPFVSAGYAWQRLGRQEATFSFRDQGGIEIKRPEIAEPRVFGKNWTAGFGVDWQGKHLGAGVSAEFLNNIGKKTTSLPLIRAGVKYRF